MQRLIYLCTGASRFTRVVGVNSKALFEQQTAHVKHQNVVFQRCLASQNKNSSPLDTHPDLYKTSTAKEKTHVTKDLHGGQPRETFDPKTQSMAATGGQGKVWSAQNPEGVRIAPLGQVSATTFVPKSQEVDSKSHETTVYKTTQGKISIADPFKTHTLQPDATPGQLAEAAAASAFEPFAPDTPSKAAAATAEPVFAPKVSSAQRYSPPTSPTAEFESPVPPAATQQQQQQQEPAAEPVKYTVAAKPRVFGGQDTTADTKKHPKRNPFNLKEKINPRQAK